MKEREGMLEPSSGVTEGRESEGGEETPLSLHIAKVFGAQRREKHWEAGGPAGRPTGTDSPQRQ